MSLPVCRDRPHFWLGPCRFCCHACTSWHCAVYCLTSLGQQLRIWGAELPLAATWLPGNGTTSAGSFWSWTIPHTLPGNRSLGMLDYELANPRTVERRVYLSCPAHDVDLFCSLDNFLPSGSPQRRTSTSLMRLLGQTSKLKTQTVYQAGTCLGMLP
jgi:hypothetical protein